MTSRVCINNNVDLQIVAPIYMINPYLVSTMKRIIFLLTTCLCLLSCGEQLQEVKTKADKAPLPDDLTQRYVKMKASLDQLFLQNKDSASFRQQQMGSSLLIGSLSDASHKDAVFRYQENDSVARIYVLRQSAERWDTIFSTCSDAPAPGIFDDFIEIADFNGDGIPDLKVIKDHWDFHSGERADLWLYANNCFTPVPGFDSIVSACYDQDTKVIYSYQSAGCADMRMYFGIFKITDYKVKRIREMICDCCIASEDSCSIEISGGRHYKVGYREAYKHVPAFFADDVKGKCEMGAPN